MVPVPCAQSRDPMSASKILCQCPDRSLNVCKGSDGLILSKLFIAEIVLLEICMSLATASLPVSLDFCYIMAFKT